MSRPSDALAAAALLAGLMALGGLSMWSVARQPEPIPAAAPARARIADLPLVKSTPLVSMPQPIFDAENALPLEARLARWDGLIDEAAKRFGVPRDWILAVMRQESGGRTVLQGDVPITSDKGAMGLMQVLPQTYRDMQLDYRLGANPYDAHDNVMAGAAYLSWLHRRYGFPGMFAAYNDGPGNYDQYLQGARALPQETVAYLADITAHLKETRTRISAARTRRRRA